MSMEKVFFALLCRNYRSSSLQDQSLNRDQNLGIKVATPIGTLLGQIFFGWLADRVGRKRMCESYFLMTEFSKDAHTVFFVFLDGIELIIIVIATFAQALSGSGPATSIIGVLIIWRFVVRTFHPLILTRISLSMS